MGFSHGDKTKVLIFGESSGAGCVSNHMVMQRSQGLFTRAAMQSGAFA
jgi:carboxylesterase type B